MKRIKIYLSIFLVLSMMLCSTPAFAISTVPLTEEDEFVIELEETIGGEEELQPMSAMSLDQYANRHFNSLADAQRYYGWAFTYTECVPFYQPPGCYGGYWSDGGYYNYYYTLTNGSRVYLHIGV